MTRPLSSAKAPPGGSTATCTACQVTVTYTAAVPFDVQTRKLKAFMKDHRRCSPVVK